MKNKMIRMNLKHKGTIKINGQRIRGIIFDMDGTLLDSMEAWKNIGIDYLKYKGCNPSADVSEKLKDMSLKQSAEYFQSAYGINESQEEIMDCINFLIADKYKYSIQPKPTAVEFIIKLHAKGVKMCVATATDRHHVEAALKRLNILQYFCGLITCREAGHGKNEPTIYHKALEMLGVDKTEALVFEDAFYAIETAKAAGYSVVAVEDKFSQDDDEKEKIIEVADWYIKSFDELEID